MSERFIGMRQAIEANRPQAKPDRRKRRIYQRTRSAQRRKNGSETSSEDITQRHRGTEKGKNSVSTLCVSVPLCDIRISKAVVARIPVYSHAKPQSRKAAKKGLPLVPKLHLGTPLFRQLHCREEHINSVTF